MLLAKQCSLFCPTLCNPIGRTLPGSSVHGIFQARILKWVAISCSRTSSQPRDWTHVSYVSCIGGWILYHWATGKPLELVINSPKCPNVGSEEPNKNFWKEQWHDPNCALDVLYTRDSFLGREGGRIYETLLLLPKFPAEDRVIILFFSVFPSPHSRTTLAFLLTTQLTDAQHLKVTWGWMRLQPPGGLACGFGSGTSPSAQEDWHGAWVCSDDKCLNHLFIKVWG